MIYGSEFVETRYRGTDVMVKRAVVQRIEDDGPPDGRGLIVEGAFLEYWVGDFGDE